MHKANTKFRFTDTKSVKLNNTTKDTGMQYKNSKSLLFACTFMNNMIEIAKCAIK